MGYFHQQEVVLSSVGTSTSNIDNLYQDNHSWLVQLLMRKLNCPFDAADIAQDAFVRLLINPKTFATKIEAKVYLGKLGKGLSIDLWRRRQIEYAWLSELANRDQQVHISAEHQQSILETLNEIDQMLLSLPNNVATTLILNRLNGFTYKLISQQLGVSERMIGKYMVTAILHCSLLAAGLPLTALKELTASLNS